MSEPEFEIHPLSRSIRAHSCSEVATALRTRIPAILSRWHRRSIQALPDLDRLTVAEFEDSVATILEALAAALDSTDPDTVRRVIAESPAHGAARFAQKLGPHTILAEERILRTVIVLELRAELNRPLADHEAARLHELLDIMGEYSLLALMKLRSDERDQSILTQVAPLHRLADLGMLVAGLAHDAANLMLPLRCRLDYLGVLDLPAEARDEVDSVSLIVEQFQNLITNLRFLSVDPRHGAQAIRPLDLTRWWPGTAAFYRKMLPRHIQLDATIPDGLPGVRITAAALSQALFNLVRNAEQAMMGQPRGRITLRAVPAPPSRAPNAGEPSPVHLLVEDDGPGMTPDVRERCLEPFFSTRAVESGSGLGLAVVHALITGAGGAVEVHSPPPDKSRGTMFILTLPAAGAATSASPSPLRGD